MSEETKHSPMIVKDHDNHKCTLDHIKSLVYHTVNSYGIVQYIYKLRNRAIIYIPVFLDDNSEL